MDLAVMQLNDEQALVVRLQRLIRAGAERVWEQISSEAGMKAWLGPRTWEARAGGRVLFDVQHGETRWVMWGRVQSFEPGRELSFTWQEFNTEALTAWPQPTLVKVSLEPRDGGTLVTLEHSGFEALPNAKEEYQGYSQGWASLNDLDELARMCEQ
ncbi:SRPBCC domain-containing protein [bacterium]|nr:SRPBCC domain-containing protein [bacterium]